MPRKAWFFPDSCCKPWWKKACRATTPTKRCRKTPWRRGKRIPVSANASPKIRASQSSWTAKPSSTLSICSGTCATSTRSLQGSSARRKHQLAKPEFAWPRSSNEKQKRADRSGRLAFFTSSESGLRPTQLRRRKFKLEKLFDALDVACFRSVHANLITFVDERGNRNDQACFQGGRLHYRAGGGFLDGRLGLGNTQIHGVRQIDADGFFVVEFHFHNGVRHQVISGFAEFVA